MNLKIRPYKRGGWEVDIVLKFPSGEQWRERVRSPADSRAASKRWAEERASYVLANWQEVIRPKKFAPTLAEFEQRFLSEYPEANRQKPSTLEAKKSILKNHLVPTLGKLKLELAPIPWTPGLCRQLSAAPVGFGFVRAPVLVA